MNSPAEPPRPNVAVIVLNWNGWRDTLECLESLERLDYPEAEIVVVDNGSTDGSPARIQQARPGVRLIETGSNLGFAGGNNVGIRDALARGARYVWLLNNDTKVAPDALSAMVRLAERRRELGAVGSVLHHWNAPERIQAWGGAAVSLVLGFTRHFEHPVPAHRLHYLVAASLLCRREALEQVGLLDDAFFFTWEDADFGFRLRQVGWKLAVAQDSRVYHKVSASTGGRGVASDRFFYRHAARFFHKHARFPALPILAWIAAGTLRRLLRREWGRARIVLSALPLAFEPPRGPLR